MISGSLRLHGWARKCACGTGVRSLRFSSLVKYALVDIDGVLLLGSEEIRGSSSAFAKLRDGVQGCRLVTNQSQLPRADMVTRLQAAGFTVDEREVFSALSAARSLIDQSKLRPLCLLSEEAQQEFKDVHKHDPNSVVVGTAPHQLDYENLTQAMRVLLADDSNKLIAVNKGRYFQRGDGLAMMAGPFVAALEFATGRSATVVGKPNAEFFHSAAADAAGTTPDGEVPLENCVMIGDDAMDDVQGAMDAGMQAILVRSGKYRPGDEHLCRTKPLAVVNDFAGALQFLKESNLLSRK
eukprot:TRINITY_DN56943_c0_g1_i1.p1 TRINITY_DN56943_c0_g1~~TRINITY_DN56943_c0_g1_i1.p1  ORF type:complete len:311 (+),score=53.84 TRINITY_DN56943_c0_g1_i1:48-935(+)